MLTNKPYPQKTLDLITGELVFGEAIRFQTPDLMRLECAKMTLSHFDDTLEEDDLKRVGHLQGDSTLMNGGENLEMLISDASARALRFLLTMDHIDACVILYEIASLEQLQAEVVTDFQDSDGQMSPQVFRNMNDTYELSSAYKIGVLVESFFKNRSA